MQRNFPRHDAFEGLWWHWWYWNLFFLFTSPQSLETSISLLFLKYYVTWIYAAQRCCLARNSQILRSEVQKFYKIFEPIEEKLMNSEESQLLVADDYEACGTNVLQSRILHQHGPGERSLPVKEKCPCWEISQETTGAVVPQVFPVQFLTIAFSI